VNIRDIIIRTARDFEAQGLASPRLDTEVLLAHVLQTDRLYLFSNPDRRLTEAEAAAFRDLAVRRCQGEPVAYLLGRKEFWSLVLEVNARVLIPRPDTEILVEEVLRVCTACVFENPAILDLGTGSGAIAVALAAELPQARIMATDLSPDAIALARRNARRHGVEQRMMFLAGDLFAPLSGKFDIIASNPPYISEVDFRRLPTGVRDYEPSMSLLAGPEGMAFHERIIAGSADALKTGGWLCLEIGASQREQVEALLRQRCCFDEICFRRDYAGFDRVAMARRT
jgi:release factor glutamine methyltransferase